MSLALVSKMPINGDIPGQLYVCDLCNYETDRRSSYEKHVMTAKHCKRKHQFDCDTSLVCSGCYKRYKTRSGLWKHERQCFASLEQIKARRHLEKEQTDSDSSNQNSDSQNQLVKHDEQTQVINECKVSSGVSQDVLMTMMKYFQESERKHDEHRIMMERQLEKEREQCKQLMSTVQNMIPKIGNYNNSHININVFLQERCKDALNLKDFVDSLRVELNDISKFQDRAMIDAVGNVFVNGLRRLDLYKRPIHCTDLSRETLYVKENGAWEHEVDSRGRIRGAITAVAAKQSKALQQWEEKHPNWQNSEALTAEYLRLVKATTQPIEEGSHDENKIIHSIARETVVNLKTIENKVVSNKD